MDRRTWLKLAGSAAATLSIPRILSAQTPSETPQQVFSEDYLETIVRDLATKPYAAPERRLDEALANVTYDQYRDIRFKPENVFWREDSLAFRFDMFQTAGGFYSFPVDIFTVDAGQASKIAYSPQLFSFGGQVRAPQPISRSGFAGFRLRTEINEPTAFDDFLMFLGASYFRGIAAGQAFGLSARGLAVNTGQSVGEEFPLFRSFWIEKPKPGVSQITIHALLDSISAVGRYKFVVRPGRETIVDVEAVIYPRKRMPYVGIAPMTGMFFFGPNAPAKRRDHRLRVHEAEALLMLTGANEWIMRPLINPERLQFSVFTDKNPRGFGFVQRARNFSDYQDHDRLYEKVPSLWIEPVGEWGEGSIDLIEVPAQDEPRDNIVAFWRPKDGLAPGTSHSFRYRMYWCWQPPVKSSGLCVTQTRLGETKAGENLFVLDFAGSNPCEQCPGGPTAVVTASGGDVRNVTLSPNTRVGGNRLTFQYVPSGGQGQDLRALLVGDGKAVSETWVYRWTR